MEPRTRSEAGRRHFLWRPQRARARAPTGRAPRERASELAEPPAAAMGQNDLMGTAEDFADQVRPTGSAGPSPGPPARSPPPPARLGPLSWISPGAPARSACTPRARPRDPGRPRSRPPARRAAPRPGPCPHPSRSHRRDRVPSPNQGPPSWARRPSRPGAPPDSASGPSLPLRRPPTRALGVFPGPCFGAQLGGPVLPGPARAILEAEGCRRLPPRLLRRGPRPRAPEPTLMVTAVSGPLCGPLWVTQEGGAQRAVTTKVRSLFWRQAWCERRMLCPSCLFGIELLALGGQGQSPCWRRCWECSLRELGIRKPSETGRKEPETNDLGNPKLRTCTAAGTRCRSAD
ncbi:hypothetical protein J1605_017242 [Eschrichtius robustus]|uniref:Basic proline-rich protein-like n=1 Tax=Eschrichtius robustus TaxID=9764 RepID=A0AB34I3I4_ESCRO|nr:hypothetical protein J1605_017242 [Eschrichtius robustus]